MSFVVAVLLVSAQAATDQQAGAPAPVASAAPKAKEKKICKEDDAVSGTRMARRICLTQQEWDNRARGMTNAARSGFSGKADDH